MYLKGAHDTVDPVSAHESGAGVADGSRHKLLDAPDRSQRGAQADCSTKDMFWAKAREISEHHPKTRHCPHVLQAISGSANVSRADELDG